MKYIDADRLKEAAEEYEQTRQDTDARSDNEIVRRAFKAGAKWQEEQFEKNRLAHCDALSKEDYDRETDFAMEIIEKEHRQPTFIDAINYGMRLQKEQMMKDIRLAYGKVSMNPFDCPEAFEELINKYESNED